MQQVIYRRDKPRKIEALREGQTEAIKEAVKEEGIHRGRFKALVNRAGKVLLQIKSFFPLFADEVIIDASKVTIIYKMFFFSERVQSLPIKNILDVFCDSGPFFSTLEIVDSGFKETVISVKWLRKKQAEEARRIITGLIEASKEGVDLTKLEASNIRGDLEKIGRVNIGF